MGQLASGYPALASMILAAGALGTTSFGLVDSLKTMRWYTRFGFNRVRTNLRFVDDALARAYGASFADLLEAQYLDGRSKGDLPRTLRQGVRIGLHPDNAGKIATSIGITNPGEMSQIATEILNGEDLDPAARNKLARFETAIDARIDAAMSMSDHFHKSQNRVVAAGIALVLAVVGGTILDHGSLDAISLKTIETKHVIINLFVGAAAIPLAPAAKDIAKNLTTFSKHRRALR